MFEPHKTQFVPSAKVYGGSAHYDCELRRIGCTGAARVVLQLLHRTQSELPSRPFRVFEHMHTCNR